MQTDISPDPGELGRRAAALAVATLRAALDARGTARLVLATGASQFATLDHLVAAEVDWSRVTVFHLDEYEGLDADHPASFRRYLRERFVERVGPLAAFHAIAGDADDPAAELARLETAIGEAPIDLCCLGIGENGHLAFNDPPADFDTADAYHLVELDQRCRTQQVGEGWFADLAAVPRRAISMSVPRILGCRRIVASVPDRRKAEAVHAALTGPVTPACPASALREHADCHLFLDRAAAALLEPRTATEA